MMYFKGLLPHHLCDFVEQRGGNWESLKVLVELFLAGVGKQDRTEMRHGHIFHESCG